MVLMADGAHGADGAAGCPLCKFYNDTCSTFKILYDNLLFVWGGEIPHFNKCFIL